MKANVGALALILAAATAAAEPNLTCDPEVVDPLSYRLTTRAVARAVTEERHEWWDSFDLGKYEYDLWDLNVAVTRAAERAIEVDSRNLMAHGILARQYLILDEQEQAEAAWATVMEGGGAVVWTATLYDVDARTYFVLAFDRQGIRIFRFDQLAGPVKRQFYGIPEFPGPENERFWAASAGCIAREVTPEADIPWSDVREIKAGNWVLWFKLTRPVSVSSDRTGKRKELGEIKVNLHGRTGELEVYKPVGEDHLAMRGRGPAGFQDSVRRMLARFVDPEQRISMPPLKPGVGW
jgi:hypothetical protein